jgi:hypothetical protein
MFSNRRAYALATEKLKQPDSPLLQTYKRISFLIVFVTLLFLTTIWIFRYSGLDVCQRGSISAYYYADAPFFYQNDTAFFRMRDIFIGALSVAGLMLVTYKGYTIWENWFLNAAGVCLLLVVSCPMDTPICNPQSGDASSAMSPRAKIHYTSAVIFFLCLFIVCVFSANNTGEFVKDERKKHFYQFGYSLTAALMALFPLIALIIYFTGSPYSIYWIECFGVLVFCAYWIIKLLEFNYITNHHQGPIHQA